MLPQPALRCTSILILPEGVFVDNAAVERVEDGGGDERFYIEIEDRRRGYIYISVSSSFLNKTSKEGSKKRLKRGDGGLTE
jgi:hypothetical protein